MPLKSRGHEVNGGVRNVPDRQIDMAPVTCGLFKFAFVFDSSESKK